MDICSVATLFWWCSVGFPSLLIIVSILLGFFYRWFVVYRQIDLEKQSARVGKAERRPASLLKTFWLLRLVCSEQQSTSRAQAFSACWGLRLQQLHKRRELGHKTTCDTSGRLGGARARSGCCCLARASPASTSNTQLSSQYCWCRDRAPFLLLLLCSLASATKMFLAD